VEGRVKSKQKKSAAASLTTLAINSHRRRRSTEGFESQWLEIRRSRGDLWSKLEDRRSGIRGQLPAVNPRSRASKEKVLAFHLPEEAC
jgi:hypothetical protein